MGTPAGFAALSRAMSAEYENTSKVKSCLARDQGHLIYLYYSGKLEKLLPGRVVLHEPGKGVAMTVGIMQPDAIGQFVAKRYVYNSDMHPAPVKAKFWAS